jgi:hypothetical protein
LIIGLNICQALFIEYLEDISWGYL